MTNNPKIFISYSWDNDAHIEWVLQLANRLCTDGVDVILDRYYLTPGSNIPFFMENYLKISEKIIVVFTPNYKVKAEGRKGGVGHEYSIINNTLAKNISENNKVIPIIRKGDSEESVPDLFQQYFYVNFTNDNHFENSYINLLREIYNEPVVKKPTLGEKPNFDKINTVKVTQNPIDEILEITQGYNEKPIEVRKQIAKKIYLISKSFNLEDIKTLLSEDESSSKIATLIAIKSMIESQNIDYGQNEEILEYAKKNIESSESRVRYRAADLIRVSINLKKLLVKDVLEVLSKETNKSTERILKSILRSENINAENGINNKIRNIKKLIAEGKTEQSLDGLIELSRNNELTNQLILQKSRYKSNQKNINVGVITHEQASITLFQINLAIIQLIDEYYDEIGGRE